MLDVAVNQRQWKEIRRLLADVPKAVPRVLTRSINKVGVAARTKIVRRVAAEVNVKQKDLRRRNISLVKANFRTLLERIRIIGRRIPVIRFGARQTKRGVSYRIKRGGGRKKIAGAFKATMDSGHEGVFVRRGAKRLPIVQQYGPSVPAVVEGIDELAAAMLDREIHERLDREITTQVGLVLERRRRAS